MRSFQGITRVDSFLMKVKTDSATHSDHPKNPEIPESFFSSNLLSVSWADDIFSTLSRYKNMFRIVKCLKYNFVCMQYERDKIATKKKYVLLIINSHLRQERKNGEKIRSHSRNEWNSIEACWFVLDSSRARICLSRSLSSISSKRFRSHYLCPRSEQSFSIFFFFFRCATTCARLTLIRIICVTLVCKNLYVFVYLCSLELDSNGAIKMHIFQWFISRDSLTRFAGKKQ